MRPLDRKIVQIMTCLILAAAGVARAADDDWREAANQRIKDLRRGNLRIEVIDKDGAAIEDAKITVQQTRHAFRFGTCVALHRLLESGADNEQYRNTLKRYFTMASAEDELKWGPWNGEFDPVRFAPRFKPENFNRDVTFAGLKWMKDNGFYIRGHTLIWPGYRRMPKFVARYRDDPTGLLQIVMDHIAQETYAVKDFIDEWDVVNESVWDHDLQDAFGPEVLADFFKETRGILPNTRLIINETNLTAGAKDKVHSRAVMKKYLQMLQAHDAPVQGLGLQGHVRWNQRLSMPEILAYYDQIHELGLGISITEFDVQGCTEEQLGEYTRDFFIATFSHPAVTCIQIWGFWEGDIQRPQYAPFRKDWTLRPNGQAYIDLVFGQWWTKEEGRSNKDGIFKTPAFFGDYEVTVQAKDKTVSKKVTLPEATKIKNVVVVL